MRKKLKTIILFSMILILSQSAYSLQKTAAHNDKTITFIELGSSSCTPCRMMEPILESIKKKYKGKVRVLFYDVRTATGNKYAAKYRIRVIPTQVFLDNNGNEFFRHEGYFPEKEIVRVLKKAGIN